MKKDHVTIEEQGLRDGIQNVNQLLTIEQKLSYIDRLVDAGLTRIQVGSFVHPTLVPQMADTDELCQRIKKKKGIIYSGLVLNIRGVERAISASLEHLSCSISASDLHSQKNARKTLKEARQAFEEMVKLCQKNQIMTRGGIQCAFGCRYEGVIHKSHVLDMVKSHLDTGIDELALADSTGMAHPGQILDTMSEIVDLAEGKPIILHLHNTESKGYANLYAALNAGVRIFDTAFGGLGGCPFIKSATGNIATEDTVHMLDQMGYNTGIDKYKLAKLSLDMSTFMNQKLQGNLYELLLTEDIKIT